MGVFNVTSYNTSIKIAQLRSEDDGQKEDNSLPNVGLNISKISGSLNIPNHPTFPKLGKRLTSSHSKFCAQKYSLTVSLILRLVRIFNIPILTLFRCQSHLGMGLAKQGYSFSEFTEF